MFLFKDMQSLPRVSLKVTKNIWNTIDGTQYVTFQFPIDDVEKLNLASKAEY